MNFFEKTGWSLLKLSLMMGLLTIVLNGVPVAMAQWISHGPPGAVNAIAIDPQTPTTQYAGTSGGVFKSIDGGGSWSTANAGLPISFVLALVIDPQTPAIVYVGLDSGGVFKSSNGGRTWAPINNGLPDSSVLALAIDPQTPTTLYAATNYSGHYCNVFKSSNGGGNWTSILSSSSPISSLAIDPQTPTTLYAGFNGGGVYKSSDGGGTWSTTNTGLLFYYVNALVIDAQTPTTLYVGALNGVFKSIDGGGSWGAASTGLPISDVTALAMDPRTPTTLYAGTLAGALESTDAELFKSSDGGVSWSASGIGLPRNLNVNALAINPQTPATLYAGTNGGEFKSSNSGDSWTEMSVGLTNSYVCALAIDSQMPAIVYAGTFSSGVFNSSDGGGSWTAINSGLTNSYVYALAIDPQKTTNLYSGTIGGVFKSTDGGGRWSPAGVGLPSTLRVNALVIDPQTPTTLYAGSYDGVGVFKSSDGGGSWSAANTGLTMSSVMALAIDPQKSPILYAGTFGGGVFRSSNGGGSWTASGLPNFSVLALVINPQTPATLYAGTMEGGVFKSSNGGESWTAINSGLTNPYVSALAIDPQTPTTLYAGTWGSGAFKSSDGGESWNSIDSDLRHANVSALAIDPQNPSRIYAGTAYGGAVISSETSCSQSISSTASSYSSSGIASDQVTVTATGCGWTAVSDDPWITITSGNSGSANGIVTYSVAPNTSPASRAGSMIIAGETFTVTQEGLSSAFSISNVSPNSGPVSGGTSFTINGGGFQVGASVSLGGVRAVVSTVASTEITATTGIATAPGSYDVSVINPGGQSVLLPKGFTYTAVSGPQTAEAFVPIVLSAGGMNGSFYTSEMILTNRGNGNATVNFTYIASLGSGNGTGIETLAAGQQRIVPDAVSYLRSLEVPIPSSGAQGGTLRVSYSGLNSPADGSVTVRTTTAVPEGRAGLAYAGIPTSIALTEPSYICGLRQNETDRSNVAIQNVGTAEEGNIRLQLTVFSGAEGTPISKVITDQVLPPGGFAQINGILASNGLSLSNGFVRVERVSGTAPYYAYGVINDQLNSDGSFIPPVLESALAGKTRMMLAAVVETTAFSTELVVTNWGSAKKSLKCHYVADAIQTADHTASFSIELNPHQQLILPDFVQWLRDSQVPGIGPRAANVAGSLSISETTGDLSGVMMAARTSALSDEGRFGVFYTASPEGENSSQETWLYGLQQNGESRTNLALVNTGETDDSEDTFRIELYDGATGNLASTVTTVSLPARGWRQFNMILAEYAPQVSQGYAHVLRTRGNNPFIAYAVTNDGGKPGERTGDGSFIASAP
ncbi:MAG: IPT/TIG domain-containing protein [Terriglobia bacterium]